MQDIKIIKIVVTKLFHNYVMALKKKKTNYVINSI